VRRPTAARAPRALSLLPEPEPAAGPLLLAEVAVDTGGRGPDQLFTYRVPPELAGRVVPGQRVRVPFGSRREPLEGVVFEVVRRDGPPPAGLRAVAEVPDPEPILRPEDLELARWLAERTVCTLAQAVRVLLPPPGPPGPPAGEQGYWPLGAPAQVQALLRRAPAQRAAWHLVAAQPGLTRAQLERRGVRPETLATLVRRGLLAVRPLPAGPPPAEPAELEPAPVLTRAQAAALEALAAALDPPRHETFLLWGVTGSGKTEVYLQAIARVLAAGRQAVVLVPEIALTPQMVATFRRRFGSAVAVLHSALGAAERRQEWWRIRRGEVGVVVGARSAVFAPVPRPGLFVVDEEHEPSYKQEEAPRYHAREVAAWRARRHGVPLVLGSATPDLETFALAIRGVYRRLDLPERVGGRPLPRVRIVDLRGRPPEELFSPELEEALRAHLGRGRQALLFLNRRGFAPTVLCGACGFVARCQLCDVALCYHASDHLLHCHYCACRRPVPTACPQCGGHLLRLRGSGTERVAQEVARRLPGVRVLRMDLDTTGTRGAHRRIYEEFRAGRADVLVGTQMVAKGWDVAGVTLVGVVDADTGLWHPDYRGAERTFQLLCQVAGRAGRGDEPGEVLVQTRCPGHFAVAAAARHDYLAFAAEELAARRASAFPPFSSLVRLLAWAPRAAEAQAAAERLHAALADRLPPGVDLWGPAEAPLARLRGQHRWHLCLRGPDGQVLRELARAALRAVAGRTGQARVAADPDPHSML
jgi:primosomal protein N' (replication factor Y)